jgi:hypothetical protein
LKKDGAAVTPGERNGKVGPWYTVDTHQQLAKKGYEGPEQCRISGTWKKGFMGEGERHVGVPTKQNSQRCFHGSEIEAYCTKTKHFKMPMKIWQRSSTNLRQVEASMKARTRSQTLRNQRSVKVRMKSEMRNARRVERNRRRD